MKKENLILLLVIIEGIVLIGIIISLYTESQKQVIVVIEEKTMNLLGENIENICPQICDEKDYDGWLGTGGTINSEFVCDCYYKTLKRDKNRLE